eukprot:TRINITY_DN3193_c0_g2_i1.p1 TRINITY_DN3193_c0_g2~~TRINITY_DN3193_c0_g2_i1.p1  ORF type:complete len:264 (-),score=49.15 TRINITY_DN3193_c0_g2_i1:169-960(-)
MSFAQVCWQPPWLRINGTIRRATPISMCACRVTESYSRQTKRHQALFSSSVAFPRRNFLWSSLAVLILSNDVKNRQVRAQTYYREYIDEFDGYKFQYPQNWMQVRGANADIFFRDPVNIDENVSVEFSSPSSSRYNSVEELGPPEAAGKKILKQYLTELMSTRLGVQRKSKVLSTSSRVADDGKLYYDIEVNVKSFASNNQMAVMPEDRIPQLEWDRRYLSVLGVENNRLYELRLQTPERLFSEEERDLRHVMDSFRVTKVAN